MVGMNRAGIVLGLVIGAAAIRPARGADFSIFAAVKQETYVQSGTAAPVTPQYPDLFQDPGDYGFSTFLGLTSSGSVSSAIITAPNSTNETLNSGNDFQTNNWYSSQASLDTAFPDGSYTLTANTGEDGQQVFNLSITGDNYPNAPYITNYTALQTANVTQAITVQWAQPSGTAADPVGFNISDLNDDNKVYQSPNTLNATDTSVVIPAGTLEPGQTYRGELQFFNITGEDTTTYPGATVFLAYSSFTDFYINTSTSVPEPGALGIFTLGSFLLLHRRQRKITWAMGHVRH